MTPHFPRQNLRDAARRLGPRSWLLGLALALAWLTPAAGAATGMHHAGMHHAGKGAEMSSPAHGSTMAFEVGTAERPLVARGARGPLWADTAPLTPGATKHGTFAEQTVAAQLEALRSGASAHGAAHSDPAATRAYLTTRQATRKLSKRCQRLIKRSKKRLSKRDRSRRRSCVRKRRKLVADSLRAPQAPGVSAPAAPIAGPKPTTAPATNTDPAGTSTPPALSPAPTAPATPGEPTPTTPATPTKKYAAAGVMATEGSEPFRLTRASATADIVNFELENTDAQPHDLYIAPADASGEVSGTPVKVIGRIDGGTRQSADVELAPGRYKLLCTVPGHGPMAVNFTVYAPGA